MADCHVAVFRLWVVSTQIRKVNKWSDRCHSQLGTLRSVDCQLGRVVRDAVQILSKQIFSWKTTRDRARNLNWKSILYCSHTDHEGILYHVKMTKFATRISNQLVDHSDVVGALPVGAASTLNYIFILDLTPGFNGLGKTRPESFEFFNLMCLILEVLRYISFLEKRTRARGDTSILKRKLPKYCSG